MNNLTQQDIEIRRNHLTSLLEQGITLLDKKITEVERIDSQNNENFIEDLQLCKTNLVDRKALINNGDWFEKLFDKPPRKNGSRRGGFGLSRGFEEVLYNIRENWVEDVMSVIDKIEDYFYSM